MNYLWLRGRQRLRSSVNHSPSPKVHDFNIIGHASIPSLFHPSRNKSARQRLYIGRASIISALNPLKRISVACSDGISNQLWAARASVDKIRQCKYATRGRINSESFSARFAYTREESELPLEKIRSWCPRVPVIFAFSRRAGYHYARRTRRREKSGKRQ